MLYWILFCYILRAEATDPQNPIYQVPQHPLRTDLSSTEQWLSYLKRPFMNWVPLNTSCISSQGRIGKCTFPASCLRRGATQEGWCVRPIQVCCVASFSCGGESRENNTYFVNPDYPMSTDAAPASGCHSKLWYDTRDICQLRLELEVFDLAPPWKGECQQDLMAVSGCNHNTFLPVICGTNNGQHMIVDVSSVPGPVSLCLTMNGHYSRVWRIKVIQIGCRHSMLAPKGCTQYFTEPVGSIFSFNLENSPDQHGYINNMNYAICLRRNAHYCGFTVTANQFEVGGNSTVVTTDGSCTSDFVQFPPGRVIVGGKNRPTPSRICGSVFGCLEGVSEPQPMTIDTQGPLAIYFNSEGVGPKGKGFRFAYIMNPCLIL